MLDGFKKFISRGNMVDMAVGIVMGGAVTAIVTAIVDGIINPLVAAIFGQPNMDNVWAIDLGRGNILSFGKVLTAVINFLLIAIAVYFCILVPINKLRDLTEKAMAKVKKSEDVAAEEPQMSPEEQTVILLQQIRDSLANQEAAAASASTADAPAAVTPKKAE
ncbi:large conductance mechanosensitive channel protein MscL [Bifidobacterium gallicum]|uniref:Large-conductance mechanosensitive channel n=1 Tax=Bifidobacterium gallicum DSM 20093 = LMG 11596 TaxID=561180 RepID=D1NWB8_9BIFI|nr:large conductance mechanosensitive channel protein MscL [Bifidobacterium gallicum]EFA22404.1 large conductance mechanosensitive channel protein [Bifidobacterium gallicum DSM 20093 = LMG 11596]KFI60100.1 large conductance mechanosensitive channel protein MscL [Bifidobacterium gallicum DSM 20093 = LMG 11596]